MNNTTLFSLDDLKAKIEELKENLIVDASISHSIDEEDIIIKIEYELEDDCDCNGSYFEDTVEGAYETLLDYINEQTTSNYFDYEDTRDYEGPKMCVEGFGFFVYLRVYDKQDESEECCGISYKYCFERKSATEVIFESEFVCSEW